MIVFKSAVLKRLTNWSAIWWLQAAITLGVIKSNSPPTIILLLKFLKK